MIPFSAEVFFASLEDYNLTIWPRQPLFMLLGLACTWFALSPSQRRGQMMALILIAAWLHTAIAYHFSYFAELNFWDYGFGTLFLVQAAMFLIWLARGKFSAPEQSHLGAAIMLAALFLLPVSASLFGRDFPETGWFGTAPVPTIVFTAGALIAAAPRSPALWVLPVLLSIGALVSAFGIPVYEEALAAIVPAMVICLLVLQRRNRARL